MPKAISRPSFPASSSDFALPPSSSSPGASTSSLTLDEPILLQRFRRPSILSSKSGYFSDGARHSPLASSFTLHSRRRSQSSAMLVEESESDREKMSTDSPSGSSGIPTPPLKRPESGEEAEKGKDKATPLKPPKTPPRRIFTNVDSLDSASSPFPRRLNYPLRTPRIASLVAESRPEEVEVQSEAAFQKLVASCSELPSTPKVTTNRGRYPEEVIEEPQREDTPSDDEDDPVFAFAPPPPPPASEPIPISRPLRKGSISMGSLYGDESNMSVSETSSSGLTAMDVDMQPPNSPSMSSFTLSNWRYTPPPTASAVRSNKRKLDDRFDPYPTSSKRRAVSPSISSLRDIHPSYGSPISRTTRLPIAIPISIPGSSANSATSSPTVGPSYSTSYPRSVNMNMTSSPTLRSSMLLASPILRPVPRHAMGRRGEEEEREIEGAGEAVNGLSLA